MNPNEDLILGFAHPLKPQKKSKLNPENFPSKIGGSPIWLTPSNLPSPLCDQCKNPLKFLLQIYAPLDYVQAYHRTIYVFFCHNPKCNRKKECIKIFRTQIPSVNPFYTLPDPKPTENYFSLLKSETTAIDPYFLPKEYLIKTEIQDKAEVQEQIFLSEERVKERMQLPTDAQYEDFEAETLKESNLVHEKELLEQYNKNQEKDGYEDIEEYMGVDKIDKEYERYKFMLELNGNEEILRYVRGRESKPLWYSESNQWKTEDVAPCGGCGGRRVFEFQINSTFLNLHKELIDFDWGIIAVYTCEKTCQSEGKYVEEVALVQFSNEELTLEGMKFKELAEISEEKENEEMGNIEKKNKNKKKNKKEQPKEPENVGKALEEEKKIANDDDDWE